MSTHRTNTAVEHHQDMGKHSENNYSYRRCITYHLVDLVSVESNLVVFVMPQNWNQQYANINIGSCSQRQNVWLMLRHVLISLYLYISLTFIQHMYNILKFNHAKCFDVPISPWVSSQEPLASYDFWAVAWSSLTSWRCKPGIFGGESMTPLGKMTRNKNVRSNIYPLVMADIAIENHHL